jgi:hypothetical protein
VVEAFVRSAPGTPVSQYVNRSGINSSVRAVASAARSRSATSWKMVLNGSSWIPVVA